MLFYLLPDCDNPELHYQIKPFKCFSCGRPAAAGTFYRSRTCYPCETNLLKSRREHNRYLRSIKVSFVQLELF